MAARADRRQLSLDQFFEAPRGPSPRPGSFDFRLEIRNALSRAGKESQPSRAEIAARMSDLIFGDSGDGEITKVQIDAWTAPSRDAWRFPLEYLPAFIEATAAHWLLDLIAEKVGCKALVGREVMDAELGRLRRRQEELRQQERDLKKLMGARA